MIGQRIKEHRTEQSLSLRELGEKTGLTASFLSQIENDLTEPSITSLQKIATALKVPMFTFLNENSQTEQVVRNDSRRKLSFPNPHLTYELLTANLNRQMAGFIIQLKAGESHNTQQLYRATEEMMYVIQGELEIQVGENKHHLQCGDSIYYEGAQLAGFSAIGSEDLKVLCVITPPAL
jgi:transcriptional regulator with XRE-family HTH domain